MSSQLQSILDQPPTRIRAKIERRAVVEVEFEIPAGIEAFCIKGMILINAGARGYLSAQDAATAGLIKIIES